MRLTLLRLANQRRGVSSPAGRAASPDGAILAPTPKMARSGQRGLDQAVAGSAGSGGRPGRLAELAQDVRHVAVHGVLADDELGRDLAVAAAGGHEGEHLAFAAGERAVAVCAVRAPAEQLRRLLL